MRPTISEQLAGIRRVLADVVAPEVHGAYPADMLNGVLANLEMLERSWSKVAPFLAWDNDETTRVLVLVAPVVDDTLADRIAQAIVAPPPSGLDVDSLEARNVLLRALLADAIAPLAGGGIATAEVYAEVVAHLSARIERFPLTLNAPMPGAAR